ncbi:MAG: triose-phosphate isomerase [Lysobacterales bacterium]
MRTRLVAGNWKMQGSRAANAALLSTLTAAHLPAAVEAAVMPPYPYLDQARELLAGSAIGLGGQDCSAESGGAFTGEVAAAMLADCGCRYVIVGHSERRARHAESDALVARKFAAAQAAGLRPVLCVGETLEERERDQTLDVVRRQLDAVLELTGVVAFADAVLAYEPVWAIGTGRTASPAQAQTVHAALRSHLAAMDANIAGSLRILYGGSVKGSNAGQLFAEADIDGGLIGGASLQAEEFLRIIDAAQ